jgi:hypothetical protein
VKRALVFFLLALVACKEHSPVEQVPDEGGVDAGVDANVPAGWRVVLGSLDGALLSIWGTSEHDIWSVGGSLGNGGDALVLRFDGTGWRHEKPGGKETYWWVHGSSATDVWLVGTNGRATHWDGTKFEERPTGTTATLFGVFAIAPNDVWTVGGTPEDPAQAQDVVLHWDGAAWKPETLPEATKVPFFKVWAASADDLYVVGDLGVIWHRKGGTWTREAKDLAAGRLTTVNGCDATHLYAVGSRNMLTSDGTTWQKANVDPLLIVNDVNGVACAPAAAPDRGFGKVVAVGGGSLKLRLVGDKWVSDFGTEPYPDLHGAWIDPTGALWGVGGNFNGSIVAGASRGGVIARYSDDTVPTTLVP